MKVGGVRWEELLLRELDDLEQQAEGLHLAERDATVAELSVSTYAEVELSGRFHASVGLPLHLVLVGGTSVEGVVLRVGRDWLLVAQGRSECLVPTAAVLRVGGAAQRAVPEAARSLLARLGLGSALRQLAADRDLLAVTLVDGSVLRGRIRRVGRDFLELEPETQGCAELVGFAGLVLLRRG